MELNALLERLKADPYSQIVTLKDGRTAVRKCFAAEVREVEGKERTLRFVGSDETIDRYRTRIKADGWRLENFRKNPVFLFAHKYDQPPIGQASHVWVENKRLMFDIEFADRETYEFADTIFRLYKGRFMRATSVGFIPFGWNFNPEQEEGKEKLEVEFTDQDLLELSGAPVPANPNALEDARAAGILTKRDLGLMFAEVDKADPDGLFPYWARMREVLAGLKAGERVVFPPLAAPTVTEATAGAAAEDPAAPSEPSESEQIRNELRELSERTVRSEKKLDELLALLRDIAGEGGPAVPDVEASGESPSEASSGDQYAGLLEPARRLVEGVQALQPRNGNGGRHGR